MTHHTIRRGLNIPLKGVPATVIEDASTPSTVALRTADSIGYKFKVAVEIGDAVARGQVLCSTRQFPEIVFRSPAGGTIREIRRGARRAVEEIIIEPDQGDQEQAEVFETWTHQMLAAADAETVGQALLDSGLWPLIQQRPLAKIARPDTQPVAVFINGMATAPLQAKPSVLLQDRQDDFVMGVLALQRVASGKTYLCLAPDHDPIPGADTLDNVEIHTFSGPHPAGLSGVHIRHIQPLRQNETAWTVRAEDVADIGYFLRTGDFPTERMIALAGPSVKQPSYLRTRCGADLASVVSDRLDQSEPLRYLNGDVLSGTMTAIENHLPIHGSTITVLPEGNTRNFMGWAMPGFSYYTALRTFAAGFLPKRDTSLDTRIHGGIRPIVDIGQWEKVFPFDIHLSYLLRAIQAEDIQEAEALGLLELSEEDVALCTFIDPSKMELCEIIRHGLDLYEAENL